MSESIKLIGLTSKLGIPLIVSVLLVVVILLFTYIERRAKERERLLQETFQKALDFQAGANQEFRDTIRQTLEKQTEVLKSMKQAVKEIASSNREFKQALLLLQSDVSEMKGMIMRNGRR